MIPPDNVRMTALRDVWRFFAFFEYEWRNSVGMALQQALEELHYNDSLYGRPQATVTHQPGAVSHQK
jgi:hypothetical protein